MGLGFGLGYARIVRTHSDAARERHSKSVRLASAGAGPGQAPQDRFSRG